VYLGPVVGGVGSQVAVIGAGGENIDSLNSLYINATVPLAACTAFTGCAFSDAYRCKAGRDGVLCSNCADGYR
jgi:hypothetical protein